MTRDEFMREFSRCVSREGEIDLPSEILDARAEFLFALHEALHGHLTPKELNQAYIILARLLLGKYPKVAAVVLSHDRVRVPYVAMEYLPQVKGKLTSHEKLLFAFSVFHSICIEVYDEEADQIRKGITELTLPQKIMDLMSDDMDMHPERYEFLPPEKKPHSTQAPEEPILADHQLTELIDSANDGDGSAQFKLGMMYYNGDGVRQNYSEAFKWYYMAAEQGYSGAQTNVGMMYSKGQGVAQDYEQALKWYKLAADKGFDEALHDLGFMYYAGEGVRKDINEAMKLWLKAAIKGNANSQNNLGYAYRTGAGVSQDYKEALRWYRLSAEKGNAEALGDLGIMYENGQGVERDLDEAVKFYRLAAKKGNQEAHDALVRLGML